MPPGTTIIVGGNGAGKTSLLEAVRYSVCGRSFRTSRESEMIRSGAGFFRIESVVNSGGMLYERIIGFEAGAGARVNPGGGPRWLPLGSVLCFAPDDLQLVKGPPSVRRRFLDDAATRAYPLYQRLVTDHAKVLAQRNSFLQRARAGRVQLADIAPWDRQLAQMDLKIFAVRREQSERLSPMFGRMYRQICGSPVEAAISYRSGLEGFFASEDAHAAMMSALAQTWQKDMERLSTGIGSHRDDAEFLLDGKSLRTFGSQGEQRTAVLATLLASRQAGAEEGGPGPILLLDDVMSELDPGRRRRLMEAIAGGPSDALTIDTAGRQGQVIITAADPSLFSEGELGSSAVLEVEGGVISHAQASAVV